MRVFVSSTIYDLEDLRAEVETHLEELGFHPKLSELLGSDFDTTVPGHKIEVCLDNVRSSEIFLMILSQRYGRPCEDEPEISMIHREYIEAEKLGMRIIGFRRQALQEDYYKWKEDKHRPIEDYKYIQKDEERWNHGLFKMIEECSKEVNGVEIEPWWHDFTRSTDLKKSLGAILEKESGVVKMKKLAESGSLPFFSVSLDHFVPDSHQAGNFNSKIEYINVGARPALNVQLGGDLRLQYDSALKLGTVSPNQLLPQQITYPIPLEMLDKEERENLFLNFFFEFETYEQLTIRDWFEVELIPKRRLYRPTKPKLIKKELVKHEGWKITASEGDDGDTDS